VEMLGKEAGKLLF